MTPESWRDSVIKLGVWKIIKCINALEAKTDWCIEYFHHKEEKQHKPLDEDRRQGLHRTW